MIEMLEPRMLLSGTTIVVDTTSDAVFHSGTSLRDAVNQANADVSGDTITFASGLNGQKITLTQGKVNITGSMTITGNGTSNTIIDGGWDGVHLDSVGVQIFNLSGSASNTVTMTGLTLQHGNAGNNTYGGAIENSENLTLTNDTIANNDALIGGGIENLGSLTISSSVINSNTSNSGGGISNDGTLVLLSNSITGNSGSAGGGGVYNAGTVTSACNTYSGNSASLDGSAINDNGGHTYTSTNDTIANNSVGQYGAIFVSGTMTSVNDTIAVNSSSYSSSPTGGGVAISSGSTWNSINTIVAGNTEGDVNNAGTINASATLVGDGSVSGTGITNNVGYNAIFGSNVLANNGGSTQTVRLIAGSPAVGASVALTSLASGVTSTGATTLTVGNATYLAVGDYLVIGAEVVTVSAISGTTITVSRGQLGTTASTHSIGDQVYLATDQTGTLRLGQDLGARQATRPTLVVNSASDTHQNGSVTLREAVNQANEDGSGDIITFASSLNGQKITLTQGPLNITGSMTITGNGAANTIIDGGWDGVHLDSVGVQIFNLSGSASNTVTMTGLTLQHGNAGNNTDGGAIENRENLILTNDTIANNDALTGGGIYNVGSLSISSSTIKSNTANTGGGISNEGTMVLFNSSITGNSASSSGGGVQNGGTVTSSGNTYSGNSADLDGGTIAANGIGQSYTSTNDTIANNLVNQYGAIFVFGTLTTVNDTISENSSSDSLSPTGGGVALTSGSTWNSINTIVAGNTEGDVNNAGIVNASATLVGDGSVSRTGITNNLGYSTIFGSNVLANNGGSTQTVELTGGSPAVGAAAALTSLASGVTNTGATTFTVNSAMYLAVGDYLMIGQEVVSVDAISGTTITVSRGQLGTTASTHAIGDQAYLATDETGALRLGQDIGARQATRQTLVVNSASDTHQNGFLTLREAVTQANVDGSDTITFASSLNGQKITLTQGPLSIAASMTITGNGASNTIIDGGWDGVHRDGVGTQIFNLGGNAWNNVTIAGVTLQHGNAGTTNYGGAIDNHDNLTLTNDTLANNDGLVGGGIENFGSLTVSNSTINSNTANTGGGINNDGTLVVLNNSITTNSASAGGGGVYNAGTVTSAGNTYSGNSASDDGSAIDTNSGGKFTSTNDTIANNSVNQFGAIFDGGTLTTVNDTISKNSASSPSTGGGVAIGSEALWNSINTIVAGNTVDVSNASTILASAMLVGDGSASGTGITNNVGYSAIFGSNVLANNGGPTQTIALTASSPAIGGGTNLTSLSTAVTSTSSTTLSVYPATYLSVGDNLKIDNEIVTVSAISGTTITVVRGQLGTTATTHSSGVAIGLATDQRGVLRTVADIGAWTLGVSSSTLASSPSTSVFGQSVTFTETVAAQQGIGTPTGTVTFKDGTTTLGTGTLSVVNGNDVATFSTSGLAAGTHTITAVYAGDTNFSASTSAALTQTVSLANTTSTVTSSAAPAVFGQSVTLTDTVAVVSPGAGIPTGTVTFKDGTTTLGTGTLSVVNGNVVAAYTTSALSVGSHSITASYGGDGNFSSSTSSVFTQTVGKASTTSIVSSSAANSAYGQSVTWTETVGVVSPGAGTPTGTVTFLDGSTTLGTGTLSVVNGNVVAMYSTSSLGVGSHSITASYGGDENFSSNTSSAFTQTVGKASTTSIVSSSGANSTYGQSVTLTETVGVVSPGAGTPTGAVTFLDGSTTLGTGTLSVVNGNVVATYTTSSLAVGSHSITTAYGGDGNFSSSTSSAFTQTVGKGSTASTVSSSAATSVNGQSVTLTETVGVVSPGAGTPTGTVTFLDGSTTLGTGTLSVVNGSVVATFTTSSLGVGNHSITASYGGDGNFSSSTSSAFTQTVGKASTTSTVSSSVSNSVFGQSVTLTDTVGAVSPGAGTPTGTVTFLDGSMTLGTGTLSVVNGKIVATYTTSSLAVGSHSITASYGGDGNFSSSTSLALTQTVGKASTTSTVASSIAISVFGQSVTLTDTVSVVSPGAGTPTGTVTFMDGSTTLGTGTLSVVNGKVIATYTTSSLAIGSHSIAAAYGGDGNFNSSTSSAFTQTVGKSSTISTVSSSIANSVFGQSVTLTDTVGAVSPGAGNPTGTVTFKDGTTTLGTGTLSVVNGSVVATCTTSSLGIGNHSIAAVYGGDGNFSSSTSSLFMQTVSKASTTSTVSSSAANSVFGQSVTLTDTIGLISPGAGTPTGAVTFRDGTTLLGTGTLSVVNGSVVATCTISSLAVGNHSITAAYGGDGNFISNTSTAFTQSVGKASALSTVSSSVVNSVFGQSVTLTVTVGAVSPGAGTPTGTATFMDGSTTLGTATLSVVNGKVLATYATSSLGVGNHSVTAVYGGDGNFNSSTSAVLTQTVGKSSTTSAISSSITNSIFGQPVTLTDTVGLVSPGAGAPTGTVTFMDGSTILGTGTLSLVNAKFVATCTVSSLGVGNHTITAVYGGDGNFSSSTSGAVTQTVGKSSTTSTVSFSTATSVFGQSVTLTDTVGVVSPGGGTPTGTVTFMDGSTTLGTGTLSVVNGKILATLTTSSLSVGNRTIAAVYGGDGNFNSSTSAVLTQAVGKSSTTSTLTSSAANTLFGQSVTLTDTVGVVSPGAGTPTGTVTFMDGSTTLGAGTLSVVNGNVVATYTTSSLSVGNHTITAVYGGDGNFSSSTSGAITQAVGKSSTTSTVSSSAPNTVFGQSVTLTDTLGVVSPGGGTPTGTVTFTDGSTTLGTGTLSVVNGMIAATYTTSSLGVGNHTITAVYGGDGNFSSSTSGAVTQAVGKSSTTSTVSSSAATSVFGQSVTLTDTVGLVSPGTGTPTGTVTFKDGSATLGTGTLSVVNGKVVATFISSSLIVGTHSITASYAGDGNFNASASAVFTQTVSKANTTSTISSSVASSVFGQSVTLTETVGIVSPGAGVPTGTVTFKDGTTALGTGTLQVVNGSVVATLTTSSLSVGAHSITASYAGDGNFNASTSAVFTQTVSKTITTSTMTSSAAISVFGQSVTLTETVGVVSPGAGVPTGTVTFKDGTTTLGTGTLKVVNGSVVATWTTSSLSVGAHSITAFYAGDGNFNASTSAAFTQTVGKAGTVESLTSSSSKIAAGKPVTFTVTLGVASPGMGIPTGTVTFMDGKKVLGTATLSVVNGNIVATWKVAKLTKGTHSISATYNGDANFQSSTAVLKEIVT